jgi:L-iditol 2-dehydrogenase
VVTDVVPGRLEAAERLGAARVVDARHPDADGDADVDAFVDCSGVESAVRAGIRAVRPAGRVVLVGIGADEVTLPLGLLQQREITLTGTFRYANSYPAAIALAASGRIDLDGMVTGRFGLDDVRSALEADADPASIKAVVEPRP